MDKSDPTSEVSLPLPAGEEFAEEQAPSFVSSSSADSSVEPYQQPEPAQPVEVGPVLADPPGRAHAREDEAPVADDDEAAEQEQIAGEEQVSTSRDGEGEPIPSFSELEATERLTGVDPLERLVSLSGEELAKLPSAAADLQFSEGGDSPEEPAVIRLERQQSDTLEPPELTPVHDESLSVLEQVEGETQPLQGVPDLLEGPEQDLSVAPELEQVAKDADLAAHVEVDSQGAQVQGEPPVSDEALISATPEGFEEGEVPAPVARSKSDLNALLEILNRSSSAAESIEPDPAEPVADQFVKADAKNYWSAEDCRPYTELADIGEIVPFAADRDQETQGISGLGGDRLATAIARPEDALDIERRPMAPEAPRALASGSSFGPVAHVALTYPRTLGGVELSRGLSQEYEVPEADPSQATVRWAPQDMVPLTLGFPDTEGGQLAPLWPTAVEGAKPRSEEFDAELRCLPASGSREVFPSPAPSQAILLRLVVQSNAVVGGTLAPISLSGGPGGAVSAEAFLPKTVDLGADDAVPAVSHDEALEIPRPLSTTSLPFPHRGMQLHTSYVEAMGLPGIAQAEVAIRESTSQFTGEPELAAGLLGTEPGVSEPVDAVRSRGVGALAGLTEVLSESVQRISFGPVVAAQDAFSETLPETEHGQPLTFAPEARCDAREFTTGADCLSRLSETQSAIPFAWNAIRAGELTTELPRPWEETQGRSTELRADVIVSKVECRLPSIGEPRYRLSGCIPARFDRLASEESWFALGDLSEAAIENAYRAEAEVFSKATTDDVQLWTPPKLRRPVEEFPRFNSSFESVGEMLPSSALEGGVMALGAEDQNEVDPKAGGQARETADWNGKGQDAVSSQPVDPLLKVRCPLDPDLWDFS